MSQFISLKEGIDMTKTYRTDRMALINSGAITADFLPICETFDRKNLDKLLNKSGVEGLRVYLGIEEGQIKVILVGVDAEDRDILPPLTDPSGVEGDDEDDDILERGTRCPLECPPNSLLNI